MPRSGGAVTRKVAEPTRPTVGRQTNPRLRWGEHDITTADRLRVTDGGSITEAPAERGAGSRPQADCSARLALLTFVLVAAVALVLFLVFGHRRWFFVDEWDFLADRNAYKLDDLLR